MFDPMAELPPESLLAVVGLDRLFDETDRITVGDKERSEMLPREIRRACNRFVASSELSGVLPKRAAFDYQKALDSLSAAIDPDTGSVFPAFLVKLGERFRGDDGHISAPFLIDVQRVLPYLQKIIPIRTETTMAKTINVDPSDTEIATFRRAWEVASDPMVVMRNLEAGTLAPDMVTTLAACWPKGYELIKGQMGLALGNKTASKKAYSEGNANPVSYMHEKFLEMLYGADTMTPGLSTSLQKSFAAAGQPAGGGKPGKGSPSKSGKTASMFQPQTSAVADKDLSQP